MFYDQIFTTHIIVVINGTAIYGHLPRSKRKYYHQLSLFGSKNWCLRGWDKVVYGQEYKISLLRNEVTLCQLFYCCQFRKDITTGISNKNTSIYISSFKIQSLAFFTWAFTDYIRFSLVTQKTQNWMV